MSKLLINEHPLQVLPSLAVKIGLNEAIILQQLHYWLNHSKKEHEGKEWIFKSIEKWAEQDFPFWSPATIKRAIASLKSQNLIIAEQLSQNKFNKTNYYTINYTELKALEVSESIGSECDYPLGQNDTPDWVKMTQSRESKCTDVKETNKETTNKETNKETNTDSDKVPFDTFWNLYDKKVGRAKCEKKWNRLSKKDQESVLNHLPAYTASTPDIKYRKNPLTYLNGQHWEDEIITAVVTTNNYQGVSNAKSNKIDELEQFINSYGSEPQQGFRNVN